MSIYVYKNGQQLGPYTKQGVNNALLEGEVDESDKAWTEGLPAWTDLRSILNEAPTLCPQCKGHLTLQTENPQRGTGIIVMVLGILLAPICLGFILIFWGLFLTLETKSQWHCRGCGRFFPA